ncbi:chromosome segregation protein SMC [Sporosarcina saromensis]|uniref:Chromosome partition protein Smc n=1 Tax=Sporosarcina saromensis TaxID=359365 RepID=A0ABU4G4B9_9BACL|nr:chromosome segregation protein SMC [Sporosarcina saromensis]MDW0111809.1 chromosome segregation protein SMC [Sporosarcina saromensis]
MFLKRVEIIGFKSFAERIGIDFVPGVTAIVGPNGSGKSNVTDAIRWVLGEQSAKSLRGAKMEDVIFAGSDSRKPLNFAEVTLILDNTNGLFPLDYTEISVTRRVFRSGESNYLLNGQQCRLKDINDVFMDSGLGKEAFSIISQGRVDEILNSRPEDRRSIFDEAAGVLKYKTRKKKAEHKLFETEDNLHRVLDILNELDTRIGPLEKNAGAAKRHHVLSEEIREVDVRLLNYDGSKLRKDITEKTHQLESMKEQRTQLVNTLTSVEELSKSYKMELSNSEMRIENLQKQLVEISAQAEKWEGRRLLTLEKQKNSEQQIKRIQHDLSIELQEKELISEKVAATKEKLAVTSSQMLTLQTEMNEITQILKRSVKETEMEIDELKSTYIDLLNEEATIRNDLKHIDERLQGEKLSTDRNSKQTILLSEKRSELTEKKASHLKELQTVNEKKKQVEASLQTVENAYRTAEEDLRTQQQFMQTALNKQSEMQGRLRAIESLEADFSGFFSGVKAVLIANKEGNLQGIDGAVAELITVEDTYIKAIETALGGAMQHIVTASEAQARQAIGYLKKTNAGRATFLPRDVIKSRMLQPAQLRIAAQNEEFIGTANTLVKTAPEFTAILENLLGMTIVAKSLAGASLIAKSIGYKYRIVTLDGDVVNAGGSLTGGGAKGQSTVFSRKAELEMLRTQVSKMARSIDSAQTKIGDSKMLVAQYMHDVEKLRRELEQLQQVIFRTDSIIREFDVEIRSVESELSIVQKGQLGSANIGAQLANEKEELLNRHQSVQGKLQSIQQEVSTLERLATDRRNEEETLMNRNNDLREQLAVLREQKTHQQSLLNDMEVTQQQLETKIHSLEKDLALYTEHEKGIDSTPEEINEQLHIATTKKSTVEASLTQERENKARISGLLLQQEEHLKDLRYEEAELVSSLNALHIALSRLEVKYETITNRLLDEYGLYPDFDEEVQFNVEQARIRVDELKEELYTLGPINPSAIEEYEEVAQRHAFLTEQRNDLVEAKNTLNEAMSEMDREMEVRFGATFNAVKSRFHHVFKEMFGGGEADLILTQPDNLLETGVDIIARPPGKKLQNLSLLSGGERALTAITLLFSIIEVRPVPFCILDEVEAALDEANVIRYSKYLKRFSDNTQFIVITHRKGTMEGADVLYGITMQESGVSKLISVKLSEVPAEMLS